MSDEPNPNSSIPVVSESSDQPAPADPETGEAPRDLRRVYYDHEPAYRKIAANGGKGWDDLHADPATDSYVAFLEFLESPLCPPPSAGMALDLGCGGGQAAISLKLRGFDVCGVDFSETAIELARQNAQERGLDIHFQVGDCLELADLEPGTFHLAVDNHALHCIVSATDRGRFLGAVRRVLGPDGILFSETMSAEGTIDMVALGIDPATRQDRNGTRFWTTREELNGALAENGFEILHQSLRQQPDMPPAGDTIVTVARRSKSRRRRPRRRTTRGD